MTLGALAHPGLLWLGLAAAAVPIVIHLLSRRRVKKVPWAAMEWLLAAVKRHQRRLRVENWLVLLLRVAALALLGLGLARWVLSDSELARLLKPKRSVVLLVDTSYSLGAKEGARTVFERAREEAERVLSGLGPEDTIAVLASNDPRADRTGLAPAVLLPRTLAKTGLARAKEVVASMRPTEAPASWPDALALAVSPAVAPPEDVNRTVYWVTDLQARDWRRPPDPATPDPLGKALLGVHRSPAVVRVIDVAAGARRRNLTLAEVSTPASESDPFEGRAVSLSATVWNTGPTRVAGAQLRAFVDGASVRTVALEPLPPADAATLAPGEVRATVELPRSAFPRGSAGSHEVRVEVAPPDSDAAADLLSLDSARRLALDVRAQVRVAAWTRPTARTKAEPRALLRGIFLGEGTSEYDLRFADGEAALRDLLADPAWRPDLVVLANVAPAGPDLYRALVSHVRAGGALLVFVGDQVVASQWNPVAHAVPDTRLLPFPFAEREVRTRQEEPWSLDLEHATSHPLSKRVAGPENDWLQRVNPKVFGRMAMQSGSSARRTMTPRSSEEDDERVVLRFRAPRGEAAPIAIAEGRLGQGRALWVGTAIDDAWFDATFFFLPVFLTESALELTKAPDRERNVLVGGRLVAPLPLDAAIPSVRVHVDGRGSESARVRPPETENDLPLAVYDRTGASGTYRLTYERVDPRSSTTPERAQALFAVNPDPVEGDLRSAAATEVEGRLPGADVRVMRTYEEAVPGEKAPGQGELSPYVLLGVFLLLLLEMWLAFRFNRRERAAGAP